MRLKYLELTGFKSFAKKTRLDFNSPITAVVGPNGSGKSNVAEAFRWVLGEQSLKSLRGKRGEDLIFNGGGTGNRLNRASVAVVFDNTHRRFNLDFDEVAISRTVYRDGVNEYVINGSQVRLKDIIELLADVSLGASGHHIISQGEADRILNAHLSERREMIEDALGLKIYHWKISESEKKLAKTKINIKEAESLRREIAPHLKFLKKQAEKAAQTDAMRQQLKLLYLEYFYQEEKYLTETKKETAEKMTELTVTLKQTLAELDHLIKPPAENQLTPTDEKTAQLENQLRELRTKKDELTRRLGRLDGIIEIKETADQKNHHLAGVSWSAVTGLIQEINVKIKQAEASTDSSLVWQIIREIKDLVCCWQQTYQNESSSQNNHRLELDQVKTERDSLNRELVELVKVETKINSDLDDVREIVEAKKKAAISAERRAYELQVRKSELNANIGILQAKIDQLAHEELDFKRELNTAAALVDEEVKRYAILFTNRADGENGGHNEPRENQAIRRKEIERLKIRLEDAGLESPDVLREFKQVTERDEYLAKELEDLHQGAAGLKRVMAELKERLSVEFNIGLKKINQEFEKFFKLMFGGGTAALKVIKEQNRERPPMAGLEEMTMSTLPIGEPEEGIDILVNLPRKKIKGLAMLSGGERALVSIALLFAMSQVNPPPFLVLDETDAALDEANSRKYGDMISNLSKHSQLILITHNRETMSRAGVLYGVTMDTDGVSKLLSIKFDQAENYAK